MDETPERLSRRFGSSRRSQARRVTSNLPDYACDSMRAGLQATSIFQKMDCTEEVAEWLRAIGMSSYIPEFRAQSVTGNTLLSLNSVELRKTLGITRLKDRRIFLDNICYLNQVLCMDTRKSLPEDGRILTHLSNERLFLAWLRFSVIVQTVAIATLRLVASNKENERSITTLSSVNAIAAIVAVVYATIRYLWIHQIIENPGGDLLPDKVVVLAPTLFLFIGAIITLYALMSHSTEEAAILALLSL